MNSIARLTRKPFYLPCIILLSYNNYGQCFFMLLKKKRGWYEKDIVINYSNMLMFMWPEKFDYCA